jgi:hypothetical protein
MKLLSAMGLLAPCILVLTITGAVLAWGLTEALYYVVPPALLSLVVVYFVSVGKRV